MPDINTNLLVGRHGHAQGLPCVQAAKASVYVGGAYFVMYVDRIAQINAVKDILRIFKLRFKTFLVGVELAARFIRSIQPCSQLVYGLLRNVGSEHKVQIVVIQACNIVLNGIVVIEVHLGNINISARQIPRESYLYLLYLHLFWQLYKIVCASLAVCLSYGRYLTVT